MPDPWVFVDEVGSAGSTVRLGRDTSDHLRRVLRLPDGAALVASDGRGRHAPAELSGDAVVVRGTPIDLPPEPTSIHVLQALPKGRRFDDVVRVLTEIGVEQVTAVAADRSVTRLEPAKAERALARWRSVARAAAEQSRRPWLPTIEGPVAVEVVTDTVGLAGIVAHVGAAVPLTAALRAFTGTELCVAIGPEGGWSDREVALWRGAGLRPVHLGRTVVRSEHAATVAAAICAAHLGRL